MDHVLSEAATNIISPEAAKGLLGELMEKALTTICTADDFLAHIPPAKIMAGLTDKPELRSNILHTCLKLPETTAILISAGAAAELLQAALTSKQTEPGQVCQCLPADIQVEYLEWSDLWELVIAKGWWNASPTSKEGRSAIEFTAHALHEAVNLSCLPSHTLRDGIGIELLCSSLERTHPELVKKVTRAALKAGASDTPFTAEELFDIVKAKDVAESVPLADIVDGVLRPLADRCRWTMPEDREEPPTRFDRPRSSAPAADKPPSEPPGQIVDETPGVPPPPLPPRPSPPHIARTMPPPAPPFEHHEPRDSWTPGGPTDKPQG
ncbi:MAG: hypothetical protein WA001_05435 [Patescibacteria group bacterium]